MQPTSQQILAWSSELRRMMKSDAFQYTVKALRMDYQNRFFASDPRDREAREIAYNHNKALDDLLSAMETIVIVAEQLPEE